MSRIQCERTIGEYQSLPQQCQEAVYLHYCSSMLVVESSMDIISRAVDYRQQRSGGSFLPGQRPQTWFLPFLELFLLVAEVVELAKSGISAQVSLQQLCRFTVELCDSR